MRWVLNLIVTSLIFFPEKSFYALPRDFGLAEEDVFVTTQDGVRLHGWFFGVGAGFPPKADPPLAGKPASTLPLTLLLFHGNAGNISGRLFKAKDWVERGVSVFLLDYRSYGQSGGKIRKAEDLLEDARSALRWLERQKGIAPERIILYGESIGSYPAIHLATEAKFAGLVLEAPFTTLLELARTHYGWVPEFLLKDFRMENEPAISHVRAPVFVLHGDRDEVSPVRMGKRLFEKAPSPKELLLIPGAGHNDLTEVAGPAYVEKPYQFLLLERGT